MEIEIASFLDQYQANIDIMMTAIANEFAEQISSSQPKK